MKLKLGELSPRGGRDTGGRGFIRGGRGQGSGVPYIALKMWTR
jgi:hypothetical protein